MSEKTTEQWFAMRATYGRNLMAQNALADSGVRTFIPMRYVRGRGLRRTPREEPVVRDLLFVHATREQVKELKKDIPFLHYIMREDGAGREPIVVPDRQMERFIAVSGTMDEQLVWLSPTQVDLRRGEHVRIVGGQFEGLEGTLMRVPGRRSRCVVVAVQGVIAVAMATLHPSMVEPINRTEK